MTAPLQPRCVVLISGSGTNLQALIDARQRGMLGGDIIAVISNRPDAGGLQRAANAGIATAVLDHQTFSGREAYDAALADVIDQYQPDLVILAGFMRILTATFVERYRGRLINIHPSLLPDFKGLHTHRRVLESGASRHGCSVHFVTPELDGGPVIARASLAVSADDTPDSLAARVQVLEHQLYPRCTGLFLSGRLRLGDGDTVLLDGTPLPPGALDT
jgi:phosphoribosylglycinamide formyltransferase-1